MATRLYLPGDTAADVSPAFSSGWDVTTSAIRRRMATSKAALSGAADVELAGTGSTNQNRLVAQFVSDVMPAQTVSGTIKGQIIADEDGDRNYCAQLKAYAVTVDGGTVLGVLVSQHAAALSSEFDQGLQVNRKFPLAALSPVTLAPLVIAVSFRIVAEAGWRQTAATSASGELHFDVTVGVDLPEDETTLVDAGDTWIEFSANLFDTPPIAPPTGRSSRRQRVIAYADGSVRQFATDSAYLGELARLRMPVPEPVVEAEPEPAPEPDGPSAEELAATAAADAARAAVIERQRIERENEKMLIMLAAIV